MERASADVPPAILVDGLRKNYGRARARTLSGGQLRRLDLALA